MATTGHGAELTLQPTDRLLILAPHPDDEVLCCGGLIQQALQNHLPVKIVVLTYGDNNAWAFTRYHHFPVFRAKTMRAMGEVRREESIAAAKVLGVPADQLIFLGYPDYGVMDIWNDHWNASPPLKSMLTHVTAVPYKTAYRPGAAYKGEEIAHDLQAIIRDFRPTLIFVPHPADEQFDHQALYLFTRVDLWRLVKDIPVHLYAYLIHFKPWPPPAGIPRTDGLLNSPRSRSKEGSGGKIPYAIRL